MISPAVGVSLLEDSGPLLWGLSWPPPEEMTDAVAVIPETRLGSLLCDARKSALGCC
jgi:hypothetical protein